MKNLIVLQSDFSNTWSAVASMKGIIRKLDREVEIQDGTHEIEPFNIWMGAQELETLELCWPAGTIIVSVVDPGVGSSRKACVAQLDNGTYIVTPDNGSLSLLKRAGRIKAVREIDSTVNRNRENEKSSVFDGRDLFAYTAAKLSSGRIDFTGVGQEYAVCDIVECDEIHHQNIILDGYCEGFISHALKWYGGLRASITNEEFVNEANFHIGDEIHLTISHGDETVYQEVVPFADNFADVEVGKPLIYQGSSLLISIDLNQGNFMTKYDIHAGVDWKVTFAKRK